MKSSTPVQPKKPTPLKLLLMGLPGSYKTTLALQFPHVHILDCDQNLDGPDKFVRAHRIPTLSYTYDPIRTDDKGNILDIEDCFDRVSDKLKQIRIDPEYKDVQTVVVDSLSHVNEFVIRKVLKMRGNKEIMEMNFWTDFASGAYTLIVARLEQIGRNIICTCHEERNYESDTKNMMKKNLVEINPLFSGRVGDNLGYYFTDVWRLERRAAAATRAEPNGSTQLILQTTLTPKCQHLKNSFELPNELDVTKGFEVLAPFLKGRLYPFTV